ncbi:DUF4278 domain-containing protein [Waterburya agarophytonicola K14]|uniref:DUF4278 domain-containing protein n=1 Tax=Waterburya agarophytonicola KI4 TaxID=2874699 RepID=A0A964FL38_9CYAN|nr:DUF4278 domain-containing protein [Waterburya agarophytonicola]MCC0179579.1 DUF4278 domain-containing protein [Waterburya agarophytonicola KI4]
MKLTYRGIDYKIQTQVIEEIKDPISLDKDLKGDRSTTNIESTNPSPKIQDSRNDRQVILIRPIHYYTYRGISYTKNLTFDNRTKKLLDIDRK